MPTRTDYPSKELDALENTFIRDTEQFKLDNIYKKYNTIMCFIWVSQKHVVINPLYPKSELSRSTFFHKLVVIK